MIIRRILAGACALCLAVPAVAAAKPVRFVGHPHHTVAVVAIGDTKNDLPGTSVTTPPGHNTAVAPRSAAATDDGADAWQIAALAEAVVLASFAVGGAIAVSGRQQRAARMGA